MMGFAKTKPEAIRSGFVFHALASSRDLEIHLT
jgi:hypothetical protein